VDTGQVPFEVNLTPVSIPDAPALQSAAVAQYHGKWLFIGGRTNGLHGFGTGQNFPPEYQNRDIIVIDPKTGKVWSRPWSDSKLPTSETDPLTSVAIESNQQGSHLYMIGGYGVDSATGVSTTFDTLTSINVPGMIRAVIHGGNLGAQVQQIHNPVFQVTGGHLGELGKRDYLVMGQSFVGDYFSPTSVQQYTDQIQSFQIVDSRNNLAIRDYQTSTDADNFHRRDFPMSPVILPDGKPALEVFGGLFTPSFSAFRQPITIAQNGQINISSYQIIFSQYESPRVPLYSAKSQTMQTVALGGISLYNYDPATQAITADPNMPFINTITDLVQPPDGDDQEYILPVQMPGLLGTEAQYMTSPSAPQYSNGVIKLDAINRPTTVGYMYGGILAQQANFGNTTASADIYKVTITPRKTANSAHLVARSTKRPGKDRLSSGRSI
jgi:hypothetical protein